jgi:hypothetical protein
MAKGPLKLALAPKLPASLVTQTLDPATLFRVSSYDSGEPFFGTFDSNRFDDPNPTPANRYGTCYLGTSLAVALAETLLHDLEPVAGEFIVPVGVLAARYVLRFQGQPLVLADLTGAALKRLGGHAELSGTSSYKKTKRWSAAIHAHPNNVDGFIYMSRHKNDEKAVVLFDRARAKLTMIGADSLLGHPDFGQAGADLFIRS